MSVFTPTRWLANRLSFRAKLSCVVLIFLLPFLWLAGQNLNTHRSAIATAHNSAQGVALLLQLKPLALELATHRGLMAQQLTGARQVEAALVASEEQLTEQLAQLQERVADLPLLADPLKSAAARIDSLYLAQFDLSGSASFLEHTALIAEVERWIGVGLDHYGAQLQSAPREYYLMQLSAFAIPHLQETLGQLRGRGAAALADGVIAPEERALLSGAAGSLKSSFDKFQQLLGLLNAQAGAPLAQAPIAAALGAADAFQHTFNRTLLETGTQVSSDEFFAAATAVIQAVGQVDQAASDQFLARAQAQVARQQWSLWGLAVITLAVGVLGCYLAMGILLALNHNVMVLNRSASAMTAGDFGVKIEVGSRDVIGEVAGNLRLMTGQVAQLIGGIQDSANQVDALSMQLHGVTEATKSQLAEQNLQTQQSASAAVEMAATVREVARNCSAASAATEVARGLAHTGQARVQQTITSIDELGAGVARAKAGIELLQRDASEITSVLEVIRSVAEQTNLLALNAAIEAARAGEQGRGFAVVADEVRSLAKRTQESTTQIKTVIDSLQTRAADVVDLIQTSHAVAQQSVEAAADAGLSLEDIVGNVDQLRDLNTQIAAAAEQQAAVAEQMSGSTLALGEAADRILEQMGEAAAHSVTLRQSANGLLENTLRFRT